MGIKLSYTASSRYSNCPKSYFYHYIKRLREATTSSALAFGSAIDNGLNELLKNKDLLQAGKIFTNSWKRVAKENDISYYNSDFNPDIITEEDEKYFDDETRKQGFRAAWRDIYEYAKEKKKSEPLDNNEKHIFNLVSWISMLRKGLMMLEAYNDQVIPKIKKVLAVQKYVKIENEQGDILNGYIDLICEWEDGSIIVFDNKASNGTYDLKDAGQLATYYEAVLEAYKPTKVGYIVIPKKFRKKKLPKIPIQVIIGELDDELIDKTFKEYDENAALIGDGEFERNWEGCQTVYGLCPYYNYCRNNDKTGLIELDKPEKK